MNEASRVLNSTRNMIYGLISQVIVLILNFVIRIIFIRFLGETYLGVNGLFSNILSILSLAEMGFGTAMTFNLYKPLAEKNENMILSLMKFYKQVYQFIGLFVGIVGIMILPFLKYIINNNVQIDNLQLIYLMFLADSVLSYFFAYRRSILNADQKAFICSQYRYIFVFFKAFFQIIVIVIFKNFLIYLFIQILSTFLENLFISKKVSQLYPFLKRKDFQPLQKNNIQLIKKDVGALILSKIASVSLNGTDNIIITAFTNIKNVGILSNYTLISGSISMVVSQVSSALIGSLGNFIASEDKERHYEIFKKIDFLYFSLYAFCFVCMFNLYNPFISFFFGRKLTFDSSIVLVFCLNYLIEGLLQSFWNFRTTMGLFTQGKYRPLLAASINIILSIIMGAKMGIIGVLLGTSASRILINLWYDPYIIFKYGLKMNPWIYYFSYFYRIILVGILTFITTSIKILFFPKYYTVSSFLVLMVCTIIIAIVGIVVPYCRSDEFKYYLKLIQRLIKRNK